MGKEKPSFFEGKEVKVKKTERQKHFEALNKRANAYQNDIMWQNHPSYY
jgi:hypothetical protein